MLFALEAGEAILATTPVKYRVIKNILLIRVQLACSWLDTMI